MNFLPHIATWWLANTRALKMGHGVRVHAWMNMSDCPPNPTKSASRRKEVESKKRERGGRPPKGFVWGSRLGCPPAVPEGPLLCWWVFFMTLVWLQPHCTALSDRQMGKADGLIWHNRKECRGLFKILLLPKHLKQNLFGNGKKCHIILIQNKPTHRVAQLFLAS